MIPQVKIIPGPLSPLSGIVAGLTIEEYHASPAVSNSGIGQFMRTPAHYLTYRNTPSESTPAKELGSAVHFGVLEPALFFQRYVVQPAEIKRRAGKAWEEFQAANASKEILCVEDYETVKRVIDEVHSHENASKLLSKGKTEHSIFWTDKETGVACKTRPDYFRPDGIQVDLKTTRNASFREFQRSVGQYGYHRQAAMGIDGLHAATGNDSVGWVLIAIELEPPYGIAIYVLDDAAIGIGRNEYRGALTRIAECMTTDTWPGYPTHTQALELPAWYR